MPQRAPHPRSPFFGASRQYLAALRALVSAYVDWEKRMGTDQQTLAPDVPVFARAGALPVTTEARIRERVLRRLESRPDAGAVFSMMDDQRLHQHNPERWERKTREDRLLEAADRIDATLSQLNATNANYRTGTR